MKDWKILLVDDEVVLKSALEFRLEKEGFRVTTAASGGEALHCLATEDFHLVVTDMLLPSFSGLEILKVVKNGKNPIPVIILTSVGLESIMLEAFRLGVNDYITKPFNPVELIARIKKLINETVTQNEPGEI